MAVKIIFCHLECLTVSYSIEFSVNELSLNVYRIKSIFEYSYVTNSAIVCTMYLFLKFGVVYHVKLEMTQFRVTVTYMTN